MNRSKRRKHCKPCKFYWTSGIADGKHDDWCGRLGQPSKSAIGRCVLIDCKELI